MNAQRAAARLFVVGGGLFWIIAAFAAQYSFRSAGLVDSVGSAALPLSLTVVVFVVGLVNEFLTSVLLAVGVVATIVWGLMFGWEANVWLLMSIVLIGPMAIAGVLYGLAARMERICAGVDATGGLDGALR